MLQNIRFTEVNFDFSFQMQLQKALIYPYMSTELSYNIIVRKSDIPWKCSEWTRIPKECPNLMRRADMFWPVNGLIVHISHCTYRCSSMNYSFVYNIKTNVKLPIDTQKDKTVWSYIQTCRLAVYAEEDVGGFRILKLICFPSVTFPQRFVRLYATQLFIIIEQN